MKIAYLGIDLLLPVLQTLLDEGCEILKVFTSRTDNVTEFNTAVIQTAKEHGIPYTDQTITETDLRALSGAGCSLLVCAGYYDRIPVTKAFSMVNFHPSPLPLGRGAWPMPWIILKEIVMGGITVHKIVEKLDAGDILLQEIFYVEPAETLTTYMDKVADRIPALVKRLLQDLPALWKHARPQGEGTYWPAPTAKQWTVREEMSVAEADRILRAFYGYECLYEREGCLTELIGGRAVYGGESGQAFPVQGGYIEAECFRVKKSASPIWRGSFQGGKAKKTEQTEKKEQTEKTEQTEKIGQTEKIEETEEITLAHRGRIERLRAVCRHTLSSHAFNSLFLWQKPMELSLYLTADLYSVRYGKRGDNTWFFPCGEREAVRAFIERHMCETDFALCYLRPEDAKWLADCFPGEWELYRTPEDDEYLYEAEKHIQMKGRAYHSFRPQINKVERENEPRSEWICHHNEQDAIEVIRAWHKLHEAKRGEFAGDEIDETAVSMWRRLGIQARILYLKEKPAAVTAGFYLDDTTFDIAVEKTAVPLRGVSYYARRDLMAAVSCELINHEEDLGLPGLRKMKERMLPVRKNEMWAAKRNPV